MSEPKRRKKIDVPFADDEEIADFVRRFELRLWPYERWTHRAHLAVAVWYLRQTPFEGALARARHHIQLYNRTCGEPDGYNETVTVLFLRLVARRLQARAGATAAELVAELAATYGIDWALTHYSAALLWSPEAKARWAEPDLKPMDF